MVVQKRDLAMCIILSIVTCNIYGIYWFYMVLNDLYAINNEPSNAGMDIVLSIVTCGLYGIYVAYKMAKLITNARVAKGLPYKDDTTLYVILSIFGLGIVNIIISQGELNNNFSGNDDIQNYN